MISQNTKNGNGRKNRTAKRRPHIWDALQMLIRTSPERQHTGYPEENFLDLLEGTFSPKDIRTTLTQMTHEKHLSMRPWDGKPHWRLGPIPYTGRQLRGVWPYALAAVERLVKEQPVPPGGGYTKMQIYEMAVTECPGLTPGQVGGACNSLLKSGKLVRGKRGLFSLPASSDKRPLGQPPHTPTVAKTPPPNGTPVPVASQGTWGIVVDLFNEFRNNFDMAYFKAITEENPSEIQRAFLVEMIETRAHVNKLADMVTSL